MSHAVSIVKIRQFTSYLKFLSLDFPTEVQLPLHPRSILSMDPWQKVTKQHTDSLQSGTEEPHSSKSTVWLVGHIILLSICKTKIVFKPHIHTWTYIDLPAEFCPLPIKKITLKDEWQQRAKLYSFTSALVNGFFGVLLGMSENSGIGRIEDVGLKFPVNLLTTCQDSNYSDSGLGKHSKDTCFDFPLIKYQ